MAEQTAQEKERLEEARRQRVEDAEAQQAKVKAAEQRERKPDDDLPEGHVRSAPQGVALKNALGQTDEDLRKDQLADRTNVEVIDGEPAAKTVGQEAGPHGMALPAQGIVAGGNIKKTLAPPPAEALAQRPLVKEQAALLTPIYQKLAPFVNRPPEMWGLIGPGETVRGSMLLLDLNTGEKVQGMDGHRVNEGELYANLRNFPESLSTGDTIDQVLARIRG